MNDVNNVVNVDVNVVNKHVIIIISTLKLVR